MSTSAPIRPTARPGSHPATDGVWPALLLAEMRGLLLHPATVVTMALALGMWLLPVIADADAGAYPDLTSASWTIQYTFAIVAAGTFVAANLRALRPHRHGTVDFEGVLSLPRPQRAVAALIAPLAPAAAGLILAAGRLFADSLRPGAAGSIQVGELLAVPMLILFAGVSGHAVAAVLPNTAAGFVSLVVLGIVTLVGISTAPSGWRWFMPLAGEDPFATPPLPGDLVNRPEWWHLGWLLGVTAVVVGLALLLSGLRRVTGPALLMVGVLVAVGGGVMQTRPVSAAGQRALAVAHDAPSSMQVCETRGSATYCAFPEFRSRIGAWAAIVEAQQALVPAAATGARSFTVRQRLQVPSGPNGFVLALPVDTWATDDRAAGTPDTVPVSTRWAAGGADSFDETEVIGFSALVATRLVTGRPVSAEGPTVCGGRGAVIAWLAAAATPDTRAALATVQSHTTGGGLDFPVLNSLSGFRTGEREAALATMLLDADPAMVRGLIADRWAELVAPDTDVEAAAHALGIAVDGASPAPTEGICA